MKKITFILLFFILTLSYGQEDNTSKNDNGHIGTTLEMTDSNSINADLVALLKSEKRSGSKHLKHVTNENTLNYDVKYHRLEWNVDPESSPAAISGNVTTYWEANEPMNSITFDMAENLNVSTVMQRDEVLTYTHIGDELVITLPTTQNTSVLDSLTVSYSGNPQSSGFGSFEQNTHNGFPILWTLSEPYGAMGWWPCKQDLNDKIDVIDVFITHPTSHSGELYKAASNGLLVDELVSGTNTTTHWHHGYPIPAYLIAIAVTNYEVYNDIAYEDTDAEFPITNYVYPEDLAEAQSSTPVTVDIIELYGDLFEMYPYANEKYGHAQFGWGGGMEHTTMTFMGGFSRGLIAHELAHQWFGDKVTCGSWEDIWLNEGFATYLEALTREHLDGQEAFTSWRDSTVTSITNATNGSVFCTDTTQVGRIFSWRLSYQKGAMVLHMLRHKLGDTDFFQGVKNYLADPELAYGYAITQNLQEHLESQSGMDLSEYFADWFIGEGHPTYQIHWNQIESTLNVKINQTQSHPSVSYFEMPIPIKIIGIGGQVEWLRLENTFDGQLFSENIDFTISQVEFDPEHQLISRNNSVTVGNAEVSLAAIQPIPNPVHDPITIATVNGVTLQKISLYNALGQKIRSQEASQPTIDFTNIDKGMVILQIQTNKGTIYKTLIVE